MSDRELRIDAERVCDAEKGWDCRKGNKKEGIVLVVGGAIAVAGLNGKDARIRGGMIVDADPSYLRTQTYPHFELWPGSRDVTLTKLQQHVCMSPFCVTLFHLGHNPFPN